MHHPQVWADYFFKSGRSALTSTEQFQTAGRSIKAGLIAVDVYARSSRCRPLQLLGAADDHPCAQGVPLDLCAWAAALPGAAGRGVWALTAARLQGRRCCCRP